MSRVIAAFAQFFDGTGAPLENGWLKFLETETTSTLKSTYADADQTVANANPLQLDAEGRCPNAFGQGVYKVILYENNPVTKAPGTQIAVFDPVLAEYTAGGSGDNFDTWDLNTTYQVGNIVTYNGVYYRSHTASNVGNQPDVSPGQWEQIDFLRFWNISVTYDTDAPVIYNSNIYFSLAGSNVGNQPDVSPAWWNSIASGSILVNWEEVGTIFRPKVSGYDLGGASNLIGDVYMGDNDLNIGASQDLIINHTGGVSRVNSVGSNLNLKTGGLFDLVFQTNSNTRWSIPGSVGHLLPGVSKSKDIGSTTLLVKDFYQGDSCHHYLGDGQDFDVYFDGAASWVNALAGNLYLGVVGANTVYVRTTDTNRWLFDSAGGFKPAVADTYSIGTATFTLANVYIGTGRAYWGAASNVSIGYDSVDDDLVFYKGTATIRWSGNELFPGATGKDLGTVDNEWDNLYLASTGRAYFGVAQALSIGHDGSNGFMYNTTGEITIRTGSGNANAVNLGTDGTDRWEIRGSGVLVPTLGNTYNIGSTTNEVAKIYAVELLLGTGQAFTIDNDGTASEITSIGDPLRLICSSTQDMVFQTNNTERFRIDDSDTAVEIYDTVKLRSPWAYNNSVAGRNVYATTLGTFGYLSSTEKNKKEIKKLEERQVDPEDIFDFGRLYELEPKSYTYDLDEVTDKDLIPDTQTQFGFIAEDVEKVFPEMCFYDELEGGLKEIAGYHEHHMIPILFLEVKRLRDQIEELKKAKKEKA